jgi:hypothetical protein
MTSLKPDLLAFVNSRTREERTALFGFLAADTIKREGTSHPVPVSDDEKTFAYLIPAEQSTMWRTVFGDPAIVDEIRYRMDNPGKALTLEELIDAVEGP